MIWLRSIVPTYLSLTNNKRVSPRRITNPIDFAASGAYYRDRAISLAPPSKRMQIFNPLTVLSRSISTPCTSGGNVCSKVISATSQVFFSRTVLLWRKFHLLWERNERFYEKFALPLYIASLLAAYIVDLCIYNSIFHRRSRIVIFAIQIDTIRRPLFQCTPTSLIHAKYTFYVFLDA